MIQVNLLPREEQVGEPRFTFKVPRPQVWIPVVAGAVVLLPLLGMYAMQRVRLTSLQSDIAQAEFEMRRLQPQIDRINQLSTEREQLNLRLTVIQGLSHDRFLAVETVDNLADQVPDYLWLTRVAQTAPGEITVEGMTFSTLMVADLMSRMESTDLFDGISLGVAERAKQAGAGDRPVLKFTLQAKVKG